MSLAKHVQKAVIYLVVRSISKYGQDFDPIKAKIWCSEMIGKIVPQGMPGEKLVEDVGVEVSEFVVDKLIVGIANSSAIVGEVLTSISNGDIEGAFSALRRFIVGLVTDPITAERFAAQGADAQENNYVEIIQKAYNQHEAANPHKGSKTATEPKAGVETMPE